MTLPPYNHNITLKEALEQYENALRYLEESNFSEIARDVNAASIRGLRALERIAEHDGEVPKELLERYLKDIDKSSRAIKKIMAHVNHYTVQMGLRSNTAKIIPVY